MRNILQFSLFSASFIFSQHYRHLPHVEYFIFILMIDIYSVLKVLKVSEDVFFLLSYLHNYPSYESSVLFKAFLLSHRSCVKHTFPVLCQSD